MQCYRILGVDLTAIHGVDEVTAQMLVTEVGPDLSKFSSSSAFCNWLRLCPNNGISGGRILSSKTGKGEGTAGSGTAQCGADAAREPERTGRLLPADEIQMGSRFGDYGLCA